MLRSSIANIGGARRPATAYPLLQPLLDRETASNPAKRDGRSADGDHCVRCPSGSLSPLCPCLFFLFFFSTVQSRQVVAHDVADNVSITENPVELVISTERLFGS